MATLLALAALLPTALSQANTSYVDYLTEANPDLYPLCLATLDLSFPDCHNGPLSTHLICNSSASPYDRAASLISLFTVDELIANTGNSGLGVPRLGLPNYEVWSEALHGLDRANFTDDGAYSWATSFPMPILTTASLNRTLIHQIASIISTQGRAFNNAGRYGLDVYAPNINAYRHPVWGRGQETPGEDVTIASIYAYEYITGIQGDDPVHLKLAATAKHFAGYDLENWHNHSRLGNDLNITQQDLSEYFTPQFHVATRDAHVHSVMCSYNAVNGVPSCASSFFLQSLLRDTFSFVSDGYVSSDCDSVYNVFNPHGYAANESQAAADSLLAGTDIDCGTTYQWTFNESLASGEVSRDDIERGVIRLYSTLVRLGYFDTSANTSAYRSLTWNDVQKTDAWNVSYEAAIQGIVLLKNNGALPLTSSPTNTTIALIGPWANATTQLQGNYYGTPPYLISPLSAFEAAGYTVNYALGTEISSKSTANFSAALAAAQSADVTIFAGGIDNTIEAEALDRESIAWPGNQLSLIQQLADQSYGKPLIVLQMGGGQVDSSSLKSNPNVSALIWGGYPGQSGGYALRDVITGKHAPAGRLVTTQYPASYADAFPATDMNLRPDGDNPGQTYKWYTGTPVYEFGHGLFYTTFSASTNETTGGTYNIQEILSQPHSGLNSVAQSIFLNFTATVTNTGDTASGYTGIVFANTTAGPAPYPNKWVVGFDRLGVMKGGETQVFTVPVTVESIARVSEAGDWVVYPGRYELALNNERSVVGEFELVGEEAVLVKWPSESG
ncbi:putative exo-1,4-beta-xylosidase xlnD [Aspergillus heteromorphus CBS 117.55]|uniref:xylan 1,4-beta-xylosidase n=1 Tax=Aspergillus heteromorphus CBS 117.55 TaxID=1448321 RepID=A0A317X0A1_9EURO|nr:putative exo-1,4-beta-xylosidase xlnD [Aspergillus heteromorphus CBS 117.55]PWY89920.1 putative exo-1,4-beta-xylosidase xlnD [Aspergillus heteromorphus CBS 117.55]